MERLLSSPRSFISLFLTVVQDLAIIWVPSLLITLASRSEAYAHYYSHALFQGVLFSVFQTSFTSSSLSSPPAEAFPSLPFFQLMPPIWIASLCLLFRFCCGRDSHRQLSRSPCRSYDRVTRSATLLVAISSTRVFILFPYYSPL
ncbi:hypothetical protein LZ31DRAFT_159553 [Colletotrichum somersetense]|nr:hypothetical protein LZ31DRAFT_159553 [Colletotrichum somersetense]